MGKIWWSRVKIFDNITNTVRDDLRAEIVRGSRVSIAAACFSMYAYQELRAQLASVEEFRFLFTSPTFIREKAAKECADWIHAKARFKSNTGGEQMMGFMTVSAAEKQTVYVPMSGFTTVDLGCERGNNA